MISPQANLMSRFEDLGYTSTMTHSKWIVSDVVVLYCYARFLSLNKVYSQNVKNCERDPLGLRINFQRKMVFLRDLEFVFDCSLADDRYKVQSFCLVNCVLPFKYIL